MKADIEYIDFLNDKEVRTFLTTGLSLSGTVENIRILRLIAQDYQRINDEQEINTAGKEFTQYVHEHVYFSLFGRNT